MTAERETVVGIDLGTTCSLVAWIDGTGRPATLVNAEGDYTTPSAVFFDTDEIVVGKEAEKIAEIESDRVVRFAKRDMGRSAIQSPIRGEALPPEVIQALILKKLRSDAQDVLGQFERAVITVPAYFDEPRRKATEDAGQLAGIQVLDILNEPTAAAIAYGYYKGFMSLDRDPQRSETVLVYDLGGGTFDVTLMEMFGKELKALGTAGDVYLGGVDWTARIADYIGEQYVSEYGTDPRDDENALQVLMHEAEDAKRALTSRQSVNLTYRHDGQRLRTVLSRDQFEDMTQDLLDRTIVTVRKVLREAGKEWSDVTQILLVGGASRMPSVERALESASGIKPDRSLTPDEAVAHGAAIYAALLAGNQTDRLSHIQVSNVNSHDLGVLGVETATGRNRRRLMIPRNTPLPCKSISRFKTFRDNQHSVKVNVIEGGDASGNNATQIGKCVVTGLPRNLPARTQVEVTFRYRANGRLLVDAFLPSIGKMAELHIERTHGLTTESFRYWQQRIEQGLTDDSVDTHRGTAAKTAHASEVTVGMLPLDAVAGSGLNVLPIPDQSSGAPSNRSNYNRPPAHQPPAQRRLVEPTDSSNRSARSSDRRQEYAPQAHQQDDQRVQQASPLPRNQRQRTTPNVPPVSVSPNSVPSASVSRKRDSSDDTEGDSGEVLALFGFSGGGPTMDERKLMPRRSEIINDSPKYDFSAEFNGTAKRKTRALARESDRVPQEEFSTDEYWNQVYQEDDYVEGDSEGDSSAVDYQGIDYQDIDAHGDDSVNESLEDRLDLGDDHFSCEEINGTHEDSSDVSADATWEQHGQRFFQEPPNDVSRERRIAVRSLAAVFEPQVDREDESIDGRTHLPKKAMQIVAADSSTPRAPKQRDTWKVLTVNTGLHVLLLILLALIVVPGPDEPDGISISSSMNDKAVADLIEKEELDPPVEVVELPPTEVQTDLVMETDDQFTINENNFAPSVPAAVTKAANGPSAVAPVNGQMAGQSQAGKSAMLVRYGGTEESEAAVGAGLYWLAQHQWKDGSWCFDHRCQNCDRSCGQFGVLAQERIGATAMALITYMGSGNTYAEGDYQKNIEAALNFLLAHARQTPAGLDLRAGIENQKGMYVQGLATICLSEALAMNQRLILQMGDARKIGKKSRRQIASDTKKLKDATEHAIDFIVNSQNSQGGWKYLPGQVGGDTSVLGWQVMALESARAAGIQIPQRTMRGVNTFLNSVQTQNGAFYGYEEPGSKASTTAIGLLCRMYAGWDRDNLALQKGVKFLSRRGPEPDNMYHNYYATQVLHHWGGAEWEKWNDQMREMLVKTQCKSGHGAGSWNVADQYGEAGGRLYMTCLATMTLEIYYRHLPLYDRDNGIIAGKSGSTVVK